MQMGTYRLCYKKGKKGYARNHAAYILREEKYKGKEDLIYKESGNIPFVDGSNAIKFWEYADVFERADSVAYREMELNIPNELNHEQAKELIQNFVKKEFSSSVPYTFAIHESYNKEGEKNLHCHLMFSERELDGISRSDELFFRRANGKNPAKGGAGKNRIWQKKEKLLDLRKSWEVEQNFVLKKYGLEIRVDCRSLQEMRREALEKENFQRAEELDRTPINISGKILYKVDHKMRLTEEEEKKYQTFLRAKEEKKIKEKNIEILPKEEMIEYIDHIKKYSIEDSTLNICTKGAYFRMKRTKSQVKKELVKYPDNVELQNHYEIISNEIINTEKQWKNTLKFKNISEQLEKDHKRELEKASTIFATKFGENYEKAKERFNQEKLQKKLRRKYQNYDTLKLKIKATMLEVENSIYKAADIVSEYKYSKVLDNFTTHIEAISKLKEEEQEISLYYPKELSMIQAKLIWHEKRKLETKQEFIELTDKIKTSKTFPSLIQQIEQNNSIEKKEFQKLYPEREENELEYFQNKIRLIQRQAELEKLYIKYSDKKTIDLKRLYSVSLEKEAVEKLFNSKYSREVEPNSDIAKHLLEEVQGEIEKNNKKIQNQEKALSYLKNALDYSNREFGLSGMEMLAINKLSNQEYNRGYKQKKKLDDVLSIEKEKLAKMGMLSWGRKELQNSIQKHVLEQNRCQRKLDKLLLKYKGSVELSEESKKIEKVYQTNFEKIQKQMWSTKKENKINYQLKRILEIKPEKLRKLPKIHSKHVEKREKVQREIRGNFSRVLQHARYELDKILAADKTEIQSTLDITLKKEKDKGYEWEL